MQIGAGDTSAQRWAGLAGRAQGSGPHLGAPLVFLHGLTFDHHEWDPILAALPSDLPALALDLPGHGDSTELMRHNPGDVVEAVHAAVIAAGLDAPIVVGHSLGGQLASVYAGSHPAGGVVSVDAPVRLKPFAELLRSMRQELSGDRFAEAWAIYQDSWHMEVLRAADRALLRPGDRPGDDSMRRLVLSYESDLLDRPLAEVLRERDDVLHRVRASGIPYLALQACPVDPADAAWLRERLPHAEILVWTVGHHFPHLAHPARFAALLTELASEVAGWPNPRPLTPQRVWNQSRLQTSNNQQIKPNPQRKGKT